MANNNNIQIPKEIQNYLWIRYLPETTYKMYAMLAYLEQHGVQGDKASKMLLGADLETENELPQVIEEKKRLIKDLGYKYPENREEDLMLLISYKLISMKKDEKGNVIYKHIEPVPRPEDILELDEEELNTLQNVKFEFKHQNDFNMLLTLLINHNGNYIGTLEQIYKSAKVKPTKAKLILEYLIKEGSIAVESKKEIENLKKGDRIHIKIIKEVFEEKRIVLD